MKLAILCLLVLLTSCGAGSGRGGDFVPGAGTYNLATASAGEKFDTVVVVEIHGDQYTFHATNDGFVDYTGAIDDTGMIVLTGMTPDGEYNLTCNLEYASAVDEYQGRYWYTNAVGSGGEGLVEYRVNK